MYKKILLILLLLSPNQTDAGDIHSAVTLGNLNSLNKVIATNPSSINDIDSKTGYSALALASYLGNIPITTFLLEQPHIDVNVLGVDNNTPLHVATDRGHESIVSLLIAHGANIDQKNSRGNTALMVATQGGFDAIFSLLISNNASAIEKNNENNSATTLAALNNRVAMLKTLLSLDVDPDEPNVYGNTALSLAADKGHVKVLEILLDTQKVAVNRTNEHGFNALYGAAAHNHIQATCLLLAENSDPTTVNEDNNTILHYAAFQGYDEIVQMLAPLSNLDATNKDGDTALHVACREKKLSVIKTLIHAGADTLIINHQNETIWKIVRSDKIYLSACKKAQKTFVSQQKKIQNKKQKQDSKASITSPRDALTTPEKPVTAKKRRKRKPKKKSLTSTINNVEKSIKNKTTLVRHVFQSAQRYINEAPGFHIPTDIDQWVAQATVVGQAKQKKIRYHEALGAVTEYTGTFNDRPYTISLFNCFESNPELRSNHSFTYDLNYHQLYSKEIEDRLCLPNLLKRDGLEHLLISDHNAPIPTLTKAPGFYTSTHYDLLTHEKIGKKLDLLHMFDFNESYIHDLGITFTKKKDDGFETVEVRIPGSITFTHLNQLHTNKVVIELSFEREKYGKIGRCIHRFARPLDQVRPEDQFVIDAFKAFEQKYLTR